MTECQQFQDEMNLRWGDCGFSIRPRQYLGFELSYDKDNCIGISVENFIESELAVRGILSQQTRRTPIPAGVNLTKEDRATAHTVTNLVQSNNGVFNWMAGVCREDLKKAVSMYGSVSSCPKRDVINHMYHTWKYLQRTKHYKLQFRKQTGSKRGVLECWVDASFADNEKARSGTATSSSSMVPRLPAVPPFKR